MAVTVPRSREVGSQTTRRAILEAAEHLLAGGGEEALSIREVCLRAGVTPPTVYHHFGDKAALVDRVVDDCFAAFDGSFARRAVPDDPVERLRWAFDRYVEYGVAHPTHYRLMFLQRRGRPTPAGLASYERLRRIVRAIGAADRLAAPLEDVTAAAWSGMHGVTSLLIAGFWPPDSPAIGLVREALLAQLTRPAERRRSGAPGKETTMTTRESEQNPFLRGNFAPWRMEGDADDLEVVGRLPPDLNGTFYRNGPNPAFEPLGRYHWFDGDGMIHAIRLEGGRAFYRNRYVKSDGLLEERAAGKALFPGILGLSTTEAPRFKNTANTNIVFHAGKLLALVESSLPTRLAPDTLATVGVYDFGGRLASPMTAHPKLDPETGEMLFFGYSPFPPYLQYHVTDRTGALVRSEPIDLAWPSMIHDFAVTREHVVFILCPLVLSWEHAAQGKGLFDWRPELGTRLGVMPRGGGNSDVRWFETDACYVFHPMNAYDEAGAVVVDVARYEQLLFMMPAAARDPDWRGKNVARLHRWRIDLEKGGVRSEPLDDGDGEFPRVDERLVGRKHRFGYMAATGPEGNATLLPEFTAVRKYDLEKRTMVTRPFGAGNGAGEPLFVPRRPEAPEDDGYVLTLVYDRSRNASDLWVLDARDLAGEPVAKVRLPHRVPYGFHGNWVAAA